MSADTSSRQRILEAAITGIEKYGIQALTTRKIAEEAGTNIASINYYFRSKEALLDEALSLALEHMQADLEPMLSQKDQPFPDLLRQALTYLLEGGRAYPGIFLAHIYAPVIEKRYDTQGVRAIRQVFDQLVECAARAYPSLEQQVIQAALLPIIDAVLFTILAPDFFPGATSPDLPDRLVHMALAALAG